MRVLIIVENWFCNFYAICRGNDANMALIVTPSVSEELRRESAPTSLTLGVTMAAASIFCKITIKAV